MPKKHSDYAVTTFTMLKIFRLDGEVHILLGGQVSNVLSIRGNCTVLLIALHLGLRQFLGRWDPQYVTPFPLLYDHIETHIRWEYGWKGTSTHGRHWWLAHTAQHFVVNAVLRCQNFPAPVWLLSEPIAHGCQHVWCCRTRWLNSSRWWKYSTVLADGLLTSFLNTRYHHWCVVRLFRSFSRGSCCGASLHSIVQISILMYHCTLLLLIGQMWHGLITKLEY